MPRPRSAIAACVTGKTETAASSACATSSVAGEGKTRKNGAISPTMTWKWSPNRLKPGPRTSTIGARRFASCFTYSVKMPRSHEDGVSCSSRNSEIARYAPNTAATTTQVTGSR